MTMGGMDTEAPMEQAPQEPTPTMTQDQVRKVVQREKAEAYEKAKREAQKEIEQLKQSQGSVGGMAPQIDEEQLYGKFYERLMGDVQAQQEQQKRAHFEQQMQEVAQNYLLKMEKGKGLYDDFEAVTSSFEPEAFPKVVQLVSQMDNAADVIYELSKNPSKLVTINELANRSHKMAQSQLNSLVDSIKMNQSAKENNVRTNPPLAKTQPSTSAGSDTGAKSVADFKKMPWLRAQRVSICLKQ